MKSITLKFPESEASDGELRVAIQFALAEYVVNRDPPDEYVAKRYSHMDQAFRDKKLPSVQRCVSAIEAVEIGAVET